MPTREQVIEMLETIFDPEVNMDIWTMGLIYDIQIKNDKEIFILMTLTTPACPVGPFIQQEITDAVRSLGFSSVEIELTFDPPWTPPQALRDALGI
jgi:metal-sulfur cluster biosynthetic enzyme